MGMAGKILFPIPERGLADRLYRIKASTVIVWGQSDRLIPPVYGPVFAGHCRLEVGENPRGRPHGDCGEARGSGGRRDDLALSRGMTQLILHHYDTSPFSEKVRLLLGLRGLAWRSVIQPTIMPKPDLDPAHRRLSPHPGAADRRRRLLRQPGDPGRDRASRRRRRRWTAPAGR